MHLAAEPVYATSGRIVRNLFFIINPQPEDIMVRFFSIIPVIFIFLAGCTIPSQQTIRGNGDIVTEERDVGKLAAGSQRPDC